MASLPFSKEKPPHMWVCDPPGYHIMVTAVEIPINLKFMGIKMSPQER